MRIPSWLAAAALVSGCTVGETVSIEGTGAEHPKVASGYRRVDLTADRDHVARHVDHDLVNGWGIATGEGGFWVAAEGTGKLAIYNEGGRKAEGEYTSGAIDLGEGITGIVANPTLGFEVHDGECLPAQFIIASMGGKLFGVNGDVDATHGFTVVDRAGSAYFGVAIAMAGKEPRLYAADFANGRIDVFDAAFNLLDTPDAFVDAELPEDYSPFNVMAAGDRIYVMYAKMAISDEGAEEVPGPGLGIVDAFDTSGKLVMRFATGGTLNAPWGLALAPAHFGVLSNALLVGNFGDGRITAFDVDSGRALGQLSDRGGSAIEIEGLWGMTFGDDAEAGSSSVLYFAAGPGDETHGLFGRIQVDNRGGGPPKVPPHFDPHGGAMQL